MNEGIKLATEIIVLASAIVGLYKIIQTKPRKSKPDSTNNANMVINQYLISLNFMLGCMEQC